MHQAFQKGNMIPLMRLPKLLGKLLEAGVHCKNNPNIGKLWEPIHSILIFKNSADMMSAFWKYGVFYSLTFFVLIHYPQKVLNWPLSHVWSKTINLATSKKRTFLCANIRQITKIIYGQDSWNVWLWVLLCTKFWFMKGKD